MMASKVTLAAEKKEQRWKKPKKKEEQQKKQEHPSPSVATLVEAGPHFAE